MSRFVAHCYYKQDKCHDRHQTPNDCSSGNLITVCTATLYGNSSRKLSPVLTSGNLIRVCQIVLWCCGASCWLQLCCCGRLDEWTCVTAWSSLAVMLQGSSAALCIEKSYAVNRYQFNRYVTMSLVSCHCAIQDERTLRAMSAADKYF